ncbi:MAG TPA: primosomal protein N' [bacterium]|nr:primosomal protein N' [bacterium]
MNRQSPIAHRQFCNVAIPHTRLDRLTYEFEPQRFPELAPGDCVQIRLRGKKVKGLVLEMLTRSPVPTTLPIEKLIEPRLVPEQLLHLLGWVGAYYFGRMGEVLGLALPRGICGYGLRRKTKAGPSGGQPVLVSDVKPSSFVFQPSFSVYVHAGRDAREDVLASFVAQGLERGTVIALMPESDTALWADVLRSRTGIEPISYFGDQKASERKRVWRELCRDGRRLIIGVRSAVFAPVPDLAGIVVLEEHDKVFKEERHPRFNARDVAIARARLTDCPVLLSDPTPSAETWLNLRNGQYRAAQEQVEAEVKAKVETTPLPEPQPQPTSVWLPDTIVVDMRKHRDDVLAPVLVNELKNASAAGDSAALYINRRGLSRYVVCRDCGSPLSCPKCAVSFVLFASGNLSCPYCGRTAVAPETCPACGGPDFRFRAPGIEMAAGEVGRLLPDAKVVSVMTETVRQPPLEPGSVIVGTRALLGFPWPECVKVVAALSVDADLCLPDFRARERTFQVLSALSRRAAQHGATFVLQTRRPEDMAVQCAAAGEVARFLDVELKLREELGFPPYRRLALIELSARSAANAEKRGEWLCRRLAGVRDVEALGPVPVRGRTGAVQVMVKVARNVRLDRLVTIAQLEADGVRAKVDIDSLDTLS